VRLRIEGIDAFIHRSSILALLRKPFRPWTTIQWTANRGVAVKAAKLGAPLLIWFLALGLAQSKPKKPEVSAVFQNARYVYVESVDGDALRPDLFPEDRQAIFDVQDSVRDWKRYEITTRRADADLVFVVRKGRLASVQPRVGISGGPRTQPAQSPNQNPNIGQNPNQTPGQTGNAGEVGVRSEVGPDEDILRVFTLTPDGKLFGPVWSRELDGGLDAPSVLLVKQLKAAVERAYPPAPPTPKPTP
jgi:hypothetical protein